MTNAKWIPILVEERSVFLGPKSVAWPIQTLNNESEDEEDWCLVKKKIGVIWRICFFFYLKLSRFLKNKFAINKKKQQQTARSLPAGRGVERAWMECIEGKNFERRWLREK